jgi:hypothetical protein
MVHLNNKKFNYIVSDYLINYDLIHKYNLKNIYQRPKIKKIVLYFLLKDLLAASNLTKKVTNNIQIKAFFIFYILFSLSSYINIAKTSFNKILQKNADNQYSLKIILSSRQDINNFLLMFFIENYNQFAKENLGILKKENQKCLDFTKNQFCYNFSVPGKFFFDLNDFFRQNTKDTNLKNLNIKLSFVFDGVTKTKNINHLIKNISFFWIAS